MFEHLADLEIGTKTSRCFISEYGNMWLEGLPATEANEAWLEAYQRMHAARISDVAETRRQRDPKAVIGVLRGDRDDARELIPSFCITRWGMDDADGEPIRVEHDGRLLDAIVDKDGNPQAYTVEKGLNFFAHLPIDICERVIAHYQSPHNFRVNIVPPLPSAAEMVGKSENGSSGS